MGVTYYCDVCKEETKNGRELELVTRDKHHIGSSPHEFDICKSCADKLFKPVKEYRFSISVEVEIPSKKEE